MIDDGIRCDEHVGEVFPPRCLCCDAERRDQEDNQKSETAGARNTDRF